MRSEAGDDFVQHLIGSGLDFGNRLILDWVGHVNRIKVRPSQTRSLCARR